MKLLEWLLNSLSSITSLWVKSSDELLNLHRAYERKILIFTVMATILMLTATALIPSVEMQPSDGIKYATYLVYKNIGMGALILGACGTIASMWNIIALLYFRRKYGITG